MNLTGSDIFVFVLFFGSIFFYFLPIIVAQSRKHRSTGSILVINFFLGWTLVGWVVALAWAMSSDIAQPPPVVYNSGYAPAFDPSKPLPKPPYHHSNQL